MTDLTTEEEMNIVSDMLKAAKENGLEVEVVYFYGNALKNGEDIQSAVRYALYEWDI